MKSTFVRSAWMAGWLGFAGMLVVGAGCAGPSGDRDANLLGLGATEPAFFSDEASMRQVMASQDLLALQKEEYQVGPDDVLEVSIFEWEANEQTKTLKLRVSETGIVSLPVVGALEVAGKSVQEIQRMIEEQLIEQGVLQTPRVGVWVSEFRSRQISVIGSVNQPGSYAIHQNVSTLLNMLTLAGGPQDIAGGVAYVIRSGAEAGAPRMQIDLGTLLETGDPALNPVLSAGDVVYVPKAPMIYVYGAVRQPGAFTFRKQLRVLEAIALAGGSSEMANRRAISLVRRSVTGEERLHELDLARIERGQAPNIYLRDGDVLHVRTSMPKAVGMEVLAFIRGIFTFSYRID
jgi:polysaccharide biosynthesis/export protein